MDCCQCLSNEVNMLYTNITLDVAAAINGFKYFFKCCNSSCRISFHERKLKVKVSQVCLETNRIIELIIWKKTSSLQGLDFCKYNTSTFNLWNGWVHLVLSRYTINTSMSMTGLWLWYVKCIAGVKSCSVQL